MGLSNDLIAQFVKATKDDKKKPTEATVYGTVVEDGEDVYVQLDGSDVLTPVTSTVKMEAGERVIVKIKDHTATVTGNLTTKSARSDDVDDIVDEITEVEILIADKVSTEDLDVVNARIDNLDAGNITVEDLEAVNARIDDLEAGNVTITEKLTATEAEIKKLSTEKLDAEFAEITYATIADLEATNATIYNLEATYGEFEELTTNKFAAIDASIDDLEVNKLSAKDAEIKYANVDFSNITEAAMEKFYADSGLIENVEIGDATITGTLVGVTIKGDLIEGGTIVADKLVIQGEDGLYYKLNTDGMSVEAEQTKYNSINGSVIMAQSITATKISVDDLVAFDATIGGYNITDNTIYSGVKSSVDNTTRGVYLDNDGQIAFGDASNYLKFFKDTDGVYKLEISATSLRFGASSKSIEEVVEDEVSGIEIGGRNLLLDTKAFGGLYTETATISEESYNDFVVRYHANTGTSIVESVAWNKIKLEKYAQQFAFSFWAKGAGKIRVIMSRSSEGVAAVRTTSSQDTVTNSSYVYIDISDEWTRYWVVWTLGDSGDLTKTNFAAIQASAGTEVYLCGAKLEVGNKATDWTPAPEDMATGEEVDNAQATADEANESIGTTTERIAVAESLIQQLSDSISMLVTDANGSSLMTQTENGWTFCMGETESAVNDISQKLDELQQQTGDTQATVDSLNQAVNDIGSTMEYIRIGVYEDEPCIELGESDSDFSLMITNTRIMFRVGSGVPTKITTNGLVTQNIEIENELAQGSWIWRERRNGNYGLRWQGPWATITVHPKDYTGVVGDTASFTVTAIGRGLAYQWCYRSATDAANNVALWNKSNSIGYNTANFAVKLSNTSLSGRQYCCIVTDKYGKTVMSDPATLTITENTEEVE